MLVSAQHDEGARQIKGLFPQRIARQPSRTVGATRGHSGRRFDLAPTESASFWISSVARKRRATLKIRSLPAILNQSIGQQPEGEWEVSQPAKGIVMKPGRRFALKTMGLGMVAGATGFAALHDGVASAAEPSLLPREAKSLEELTARLRGEPRRRDFKTVPMILNHPDQWDHAALSEVIAYRAAPKQVWDNTRIAGPWLNDMRNSLNTQVWSFEHPDFLVVSATHGTAGLALFGPGIWKKSQLAKLTGGKVESTTPSA